MVKPISVQVIAPVLTDLRHRTHLTGGGKWCIIDLGQKVLR
jgi:hypothetical protein